MSIKSTTNNPLYKGLLYCGALILILLKAMPSLAPPEPGGCLCGQMGTVHTESVTSLIPNGQEESECNEPCGLCRLVPLTLQAKKVATTDSDHKTQSTPLLQKTPVKRIKLSSCRGPPCMNRQV